jgi:hypothetical protein
MEMGCALTVTQNQFLDSKAFALAQVRDARIDEKPSGTAEIARPD